MPNLTNCTTTGELRCPAAPGSLMGVLPRAGPSEGITRQDER
jgi:hypothetical protein